MQKRQHEKSCEAVGGGNTNLSELLLLKIFAIIRQPQPLLGRHL